MPYKPPYTLDSTLLKLMAKVTQLLGQIEGYQLLTGNARLRRENRIKSLQSSLAIEGNTLTEKQITAMLDGKLVLGPPKEILEMKNALAVYEKLDEWNSESEDDLLKSHGLLMAGLIPDAGRYRQRGVGVVDGTKVIHIAPPARQVPALMGDLFDYLLHYGEETIVKSCVFDYEFEFIHPFSDGNGRMGRLWQTLILKDAFPILAYIPFESIIYQRQQGYYKALQDSQSVGHSNPFIFFMLNALITGLENTLDTVGQTQNGEERMAAFRERIKANQFSRKDYQLYFKNISTATASRDLAAAVVAGLLGKEGDKRATRYQFR